MADEILDIKKIGQISDRLYQGVSEIIDDSMRQVAVYVNAQSSMTFWNVGTYITNDMNYQTYSAYGQKILATLSQRLMERYGKLPDKQWFIDKLNRSILIAKEHGTR